MRTLLRVVDCISEGTGKTLSAAPIVLIILLCYEVIMRYVFNAPTVWSYEVSGMLGLTIIALGLAYTHRHHGHIRVDVIYTRLSPRGRALIDVVCGFLLFLPLMIMLSYTAADRMWFSWSMNETMIQTHWYPPAAPIRTVLFLGLSLFVLQGMAQLIRDLYLLIRNEPL